MNAILALPMPVRLAGLALIGAVLGCLVNLAIYALAFHPRSISPWQRPAKEAPPRQWADFVPIFGWLGLSREASVHGGGYWVRPLLIELASAVGLPALYVWEASSKLAPLMFVGAGMVTALDEMLHWQFLAHAILFGLMLVATFIDFDEQTIPDSITVPGTLLGLLLMSLVPQAMLPVIRGNPPIGPQFGPLLFTSTDFWPAQLNGWHGLALGSAIFTGWCLAMIPALMTLRRGWPKALRYYFASICREHAWWQMLLLAALGSGYITYVWSGGATRWQGLLNALIGLAGGGLIIWGVRIVGWLGLRKEAMGFGDVTFMAMVGVYVGWQASLVIFFLSPIAALVVSVAQYLLTGRQDIAFGPYLALTSVYVILDWARIWAFIAPNFQAGPLWFIPTFFAAGLLVMLGLLMLWRLTKQAIWGEA